MRITYKENKIFTTKFSTKLITVITILLLTLSSIQPALAAPTNDLFANVTITTSLPFDDTVATNRAVNEVGEPSPDCTNIFFHHTIWHYVVGR